MSLLKEFIGRKFGARTSEVDLTPAEVIYG